MEYESVRSIISLSTPIPRPPVGGIPYSSALMKSSSIMLASSSPSSRFLTCCRNLSFWSIGSLSSEYALPFPPYMKSSNLSVSSGLSGFLGEGRYFDGIVYNKCRLDKMLLDQFLKYQVHYLALVSLSSTRSFARAAALLLLSVPILSKSMPEYSSTASLMLILFHGVVRSISCPW